MVTPHPCLQSLLWSMRTPYSCATFFLNISWYVTMDYQQCIIMYGSGLDRKRYYDRGYCQLNVLDVILSHGVFCFQCKVTILYLFILHTGQLYTLACKTDKNHLKLGFLVHIIPNLNESFFYDCIFRSVVKKIWHLFSYNLLVTFNETPSRKCLKKARQSLTM